MKRILTISAIVILCSSMFLSCKDENTVETYAKITVYKSGNTKSGTAVYMFDEESGTDTLKFNPLYAIRNVTTDSKGVATFNLSDNSYINNVIEEQTTLYFGVFDSNDLLGSATISIDKGETKTATIEY